MSACAVATDRLDLLRALERKVLWLAAWTIHHANHLRPRRDSLKVGGHQSSCASVVTLMTALYFDTLRAQDRVAVKPHASPVFHAIQYLLGRQTRERLERFRALGGAQSYPSRTKDADDVDFSTGSVGLGVAMTLFASLARDYSRLKGWLDEADPDARMIAVVGDAELDEGNVFEALLEGWKHELRNVWWIIDYNRQSLDAVVEDRLFYRFQSLFGSLGWRVETLKYGRELERAFERRGGGALRAWLDACPNGLYAALVAKGGGGWREHLLADLGDSSGVRELLDEHDDASLHALMTNLGGHDMEAVVDAFRRATVDDTPTCFLAYTVKGWGLPFAGHKDNHAGLMSPAQMAEFQRAQGVAPGAEWEPFAGLGVPEEELRALLQRVPSRAPRRLRALPVPVPEALPLARKAEMSTQEGFGRLLQAVARRDDEFAARIVTASPDVTVSTSLGGWVNRRGLFHTREREDAFRAEHVASMQRWSASPRGQHFELGIAENNLFLLLAALGLSHSLFGVRLLPVGTLYDPFISRGLDALNYACYQDARFLLVATPSGVSLAPEGGAHQSVLTPLVGLGQPGLTAYEPAYVDELAEILRFAFEHLQAEDGGSVYLRLSTRPLPQPERSVDAALRRALIEGGYWRVAPAAGATLAIVCSGAVTPEALEAHRALCRERPGTGLLAVTSADRLHRGWREAQRAREAGAAQVRSHVEVLLGALAPDAALVSVIDGHPATLSWLGSVRGQRIVALGVERFGESGDLRDLYALHGIDADAIAAAATLAHASERRAAATSPDPPRVGPGVECALDASLAACRALNDRDARLGLTPIDFAIRALALAARELADAGAELGLPPGPRRAGIDVALVVPAAGASDAAPPVIRCADACGLAEIATQRRALEQRAREGRPAAEARPDAVLGVSSDAADPPGASNGARPVPKLLLRVGAPRAGGDCDAATDAPRVATLGLIAAAGVGDAACHAALLAAVRERIEDPRRLLL